MEVGFKTDTGRKRNNNEDAGCIMLQDKVFIIADGVGGNNSGEVASKTAVQGISKYVEEHSLNDVSTPEEIKAYFEDCINKVNNDVIAKSQSCDENNGMATTLLIAYFVNNLIYVINVGDSRAYIYRNGVLTQITEDHTYVNTLLKAGIISKHEAETHERRNMLTRAIGADIEAVPDFFVSGIKAGDIILMCTDGLYGEVNKKEIEEKLAENLDMSSISSILTALANKKGGNDNITIICMRVTEEDIDE